MLSTSGLAIAVAFAAGRKAAVFLVLRPTCATNVRRLSNSLATPISGQAYSTRFIVRAAGSEIGHRPIFRRILFGVVGARNY